MILVFVLVLSIEVQKKDFLITLGKETNVFRPALFLVHCEGD